MLTPSRPIFIFPAMSTMCMSLHKSEVERNFSAGTGTLTILSVSVGSGKKIPVSVLVSVKTGFNPNYWSFFLILIF